MTIYKTIYRISGNKDPYKEIKRSCTQRLLSMYSEFKRKITASKDSLYTALKFAALGNAIDLGADHNFDLNKVLENLDCQNFDMCEYDEFKKVLKKAKNILYIADNAGETVFDKLLIEQLNRPITYIVRSNPIINDATLEDACYAGIDKIAEIIASGCDAPGTILRLCTTQFRKVFREADMVISKGQGNYETLSGQKRPIFFLLKLKCQVVVREIGSKQGSIVLISNKYAR